jgi:hypothetical protein
VLPLTGLPPFTAYGDVILRLVDPLDPLNGSAPIPFSVLFTYADGFTSLGFYDSATGTISTDNANTVNAWLPGSYPIADPRIVVPTTDVVAIDPTVPEPSSALLLATAVGVGARLRRQSYLYRPPGQKAIVTSSGRAPRGCAPCPAAASW